PRPGPEAEEADGPEGCAGTAGCAGAAGRAWFPGCGLGGMLMRWGSPVVRSTRAAWTADALGHGRGAPPLPRGGRRPTGHGRADRPPSAAGGSRITWPILAAPPAAGGHRARRGRRGWENARVLADRLDRATPPV